MDKCHQDTSMTRDNYKTWGDIEKTRGDIEKTQEDRGLGKTSLSRLKTGGKT